LIESCLAVSAAYEQKMHNFYFRSKDWEDRLGQFKRCFYYCRNADIVPKSSSMWAGVWFVCDFARKIVRWDEDVGKAGQALDHRQLESDGQTADRNKSFFIRSTTHDQVFRNDKAHCVNLVFDSIKLSVKNFSDWCPKPHDLKA